MSASQTPLLLDRGGGSNSNSTSTSTSSSSSGSGIWRSTYTATISSSIHFSGDFKGDHMVRWVSDARS